jgi:hypothetical protein
MEAKLLDDGHDDIVANARMEVKLLDDDSNGILTMTSQRWSSLILRAKRMMRVCKCCGEVHDVNDIDECHRIHREQSICPRCGLIHNDYDSSVLIIDDFATSNCELYIPNVNEFQMEDEIIILLDHVQERVDELSPRLQKWKKEQDAKTDR